MSEVGEFFTRLLDPSGFNARWANGPGWTAFLGWLHIIADLAIFGAYFAIPITLAIFLLRRRDVPFPGTAWLFVAFILSCGIWHLIDALLFYWPVYRLSGLVKVMTAAISWVTVVAMIRLMPSALRVPAIRAENEQLHVTVAELKDRQAALESVREHLERRSTDLTMRARRLHAALDSAGASAVQWELDSGRIIWALGAPGALRSGQTGGAGGGVGGWSCWEQVLGTDGYARLKEAAARAKRHGLPLDVQIEAEGGVLRIAASADAEVRGEPATFTGMIRQLTPAEAKPMTIVRPAVELAGGPARRSHSASHHPQ